MTSLMLENLSLLDRMNEGLIVLSDIDLNDSSNAQLTFASKPAI